MTYLLYNPTANSGNQAPRYEALEEIKKIYQTVTEYDFTSMNFKAFAASLTPNDTTVLVGGDGTLNKFAQLYHENKIPGKLLYFAGGTGNDFINDINKPKGLVELNQYLTNLPIVKVKDKEYVFLNNVAFGLDGMVCEIADERKKQNKKYNYAKIAAKLLLLSYKRCNAKVTIDDKTVEYKKVWLASTMNGRYYGGGLPMAPEQDRFSDYVSIPVFHGGIRLFVALIFSSIYTGKHVKHKKIINITKGKKVHVEFDEPRPLQIDGELIKDVTSYDVICR